MIINTENRGGCVVASVAGDVTHAVSGEFQSALLGALGEADGVVLDLMGVGILTSAGLRTLLLLHREAVKSKKRVVLAAVPAGVRDVMEVTGFWEQFETAEKVGDAVASLGGAGV